MQITAPPNMLWPLKSPQNCSNGSSFMRRGGSLAHQDILRQRGWRLSWPSRNGAGSSPCNFCVLATSTGPALGAPCSWFYSGKRKKQADANFVKHNPFWALCVCVALCDVAKLEQQCLKVMRARVWSNFASAANGRPLLALVMGQFWSQRSHAANERFLEQKQKAWKSNDSNTYCPTTFLTSCCPSTEPKYTNLNPTPA